MLPGASDFGVGLFSDIISATVISFSLTGRSVVLVFVVDVSVVFVGDVAVVFAVDVSLGIFVSGLVSSVFVESTLLVSIVNVQ